MRHHSIALDPMDAPTGFAIDDPDGTLRSDDLHGERRDGTGVHGERRLSNLAL